jgi:hypothetical protein
VGRRTGRWRGRAERDGQRGRRHLRHRSLRLARGDHRTRGRRAGYVRDYDPDGAEGAEGAADDDEDDYDLGDLDDDAEFDELGMEGLFLPVTSLWQVLGAIDDEDCLTPLGWWGLPEAMRRVWAPSGGAQA